LRAGRGQFLTQIKRHEQPRVPAWFAGSCGCGLRAAQ
jgi:hypothetical protein